MAVTPRTPATGSNIRGALSFGYVGPVRTEMEVLRGGALRGQMNNERASRSIEPRLSLSAPERPCALPFGKDTHNLEINPSGGIDPDQPLVTKSIAPAVNATGPHALLMAIFFSLFCASGLFGSVTVSTPFLKCASILSASTPSGTPNERWKEP